VTLVHFTIFIPNDFTQEASVVTARIIFHSYQRDSILDWPPITASSFNI